MKFPSMPMIDGVVMRVRSQSSLAWCSSLIIQHHQILIHSDQCTNGSRAYGWEH